MTNHGQFEAWKPWSLINGKDLAHYVQPEAVNLLRLSVSSHDLHHPDRKGGRRELVQTLYERLVEADISYNKEPQSAAPGRQVIRTPQQVLKVPGHGTCLDLAVLFAGLCLGYDLIPVLVMLNGHVLVAISLSHRLGEDEYVRSEYSLFQNGECGTEEGIAELRRLVQRGDYLAVECTGFARSESLDPSFPEGSGRKDGYLSFDRALQAGIENLSDARRKFHYALDIITLHRGGIEPYALLPELLTIDSRPSSADQPGLIERSAPRPRRSLSLEQDLLSDLREKIQAKVDKEARDLLDEVGASFDAHDFGKVVDLRNRILDWLSSEGRDSTGSARGIVYFLLADMALLEAGIWREDPEVALASAREYGKQALLAYGDEITEEGEIRLTSLDAKIACLSDDQTEALAILDDSDAPTHISLKLAILLDQKRYDEACHIVADLRPHEKWCSKAVAAYVLNGEEHKAAELIEWAKGGVDATCHHQCLLRYAEALVSPTIDRSEPSFGPQSLTPDQTSAMRRAIEVLRPVLGPAEAAGRARSGIEIDAHAIACRIALWLGDVEHRTRWLHILAVAEPVPMEFGNAAYRGDVDTPPDLPSRFRRDYPRSLEAHMLAGVLEARKLNRPREAIQSLETVMVLANSPDQKLKLARCLFEASTASLTDLIPRASDLVRRLLGDDHPFVSLMKAYQLLEADDSSGAEAIIAEQGSERDPFWFQLSAKLKVKRNDLAGATEDYISAGLLLGSTELLGMGAEIARSAGMRGRESFALTKLLELDPNELNARKGLAMNFLADQFYDKAVEEFAILHDKGADEKELVFNHAVALCHSGRAPEGLDKFRLLATRHPDWLLGIGACAQILHLLGQSGEAFLILHEARDRFWSDSRFLMEYVTISHAARREREANEALGRLLEIERPQEGSSAVLRMFTFDDFKEMAQERRDNQEEFGRLILKGRIPWLVAGGMLGRIPSRDWSYRTQSIGGEQPLAAAEFGIYSTNAFRIKSDLEGCKTLEPIRCPAPGTTVVADLTSLITLDRLGVLDEAATYFGKILIPASYQWELLFQQEQLRPIQPARLDALVAIRDAVDQGRITLRHPGGPTGGVAYLREYEDLQESADSEAGPPTLGVRDVADELHRSGLIGDEVASAVRNSARRAASWPPESVRSAFQSTPIVSDEATLASLHEHGALDPFLDRAQVCLEKDCEARIRSELYVREFDGEILAWHDSLRRRLATDPRFEARPVPALDELVSDGVPEGGDELTDVQMRRFIPIHAYQVAAAASLPLLVDDRTIQSVIFNDDLGSNQAAFGTVELVHTLADTNRLQMKRAVQILLQLTRWRYRFVLFAPSHLAALARSHRAYPPGEPLREVARYIHSCMRDPGLFGGLEPTSTPTSLAVHVHKQWIMILSEFLAIVWTDGGYSDDAAAALTRWTVHECLPSPPANSPPVVMAGLDRYLPNLLLAGLLGRPAAFADPTRLNLALRSVAEAFSMSDQAYVRTIAESLLPVVEGEDADPNLEATCRACAMAAIAHLQSLNDDAVYLYQRLGLVNDLAPERVYTPAQIEDISDARQAKTGCPHGPFTLIQAEDDSPPHLVAVRILLFDHDPRVRSAALDYLKALVGCRPAVLSNFTKLLIEELSDEILSTDRDKWLSAACRLVQVLDEDYLLNLAALRQSLWLASHELIREAWSKLLRPRLSPLAAVEASELDPAHPRDSALSDIERIAEGSATVAHALDAYIERFGHLPLAPPLTSGSLLRRWVELHPSETNVWSQVWNWTRSSPDPLRKYHACRVFLEEPAFVPEGCHSQFWDEMAGTLKRSAPAYGPKPGSSPLDMMTDCAAFYYFHLGMHVPGHDPDKLSRLTWWLARRLVDAVEHPGLGRRLNDDYRAWTHREIIAPSSFLERLLSRLDSAGTAPSPLGYATTYGGCPWSLSLLAALQEGTSALHPENASEDAIGAVTDSIIEHLVLGFPICSEDLSHGSFAFSGAIGRAVVFWYDVEPREDKRQAMAFVLKQHVRLSDPKAAVSTFQSLLESEPLERRIFLNLFATLVRFGEVEHCLESLVDATWFLQSMVELCDEDAELLLDSLIAAAWRYRGEFSAKLPHLIAGAADSEGLPAGRERLLTQFLVVACVSSGTVSALRSLAAANRRTEELGKVRSALESYITIASPLVASRIRVILANLPPETVGSNPKALPAPAG